MPKRGLSSSPNCEALATPTSSAIASAWFQASAGWRGAAGARARSHFKADQLSESTTEIGRGRGAGRCRALRATRSCGASRTSTPSRGPRASANRVAHRRHIGNAAQPQVVTSPFRGELTINVAENHHFVHIVEMREWFGDLYALQLGEGCSGVSGIEVMPSSRRCAVCLTTGKFYRIHVLSHPPY